MKTLFITGGASGIGRSACLLFAEKGYSVYVLDKDSEVCEKFIEDIKVRKMESQITIFKGDISDRENVIDIANHLKNNDVRINVLVNNASAFNGMGLDADEEDWKEILNTNIIGTMVVTKQILPLIQKDGGAIINMASISGIVAQPKYLLYSACKAAIINITKCLALDLSQYNIRVNSISPSTVWTENNAYYIPRDYGVDKDGAGKHPLLGGKQIIKRVADAREVANVIYFLGNEESSFITGENIAVDGGYLAL